MIFESVGVASVACVDAPEVVTSADLELGFASTLDRIGSRPGLIEALTGVRSRRFFPVDVQPSDAATQAGLAAIEAAQVQASDIDIIINTSVCKDFIEPSVASLVHRNLGLKRSCLNFDIGNACLGFLDAMSIVATMIESGRARYGLIVDGENSRFVVEETVARLSREDADADMLRDHFATLTLGSGGAAMVLGPSDQTAHTFRGGVSLAATEYNHLCRGHNDRMITDAQGLLKAGVELARDAFDEACQQFGWSAENLDHLVLHQVGSVHTRALLKALGLDRDKAQLIYPEFGNIGPASIPITLAKASQSEDLSPGDRIALMGIGSGLNVSMTEIKW
jgi:acyl-CoA:acyl-CoA alkyltransferase